MALGYVRAANGAITTFSVPGAGTGEFQGTEAMNINPSGDVTGDYLDGNNVYHGFVRDKHGAFTTIDVPGAGTGEFQGTLPVNNDAPGGITGVYLDAGNVYHGFLAK